MNLFQRTLKAIRGKSVYQGLPPDLQGNRGWEFLSGYFNSWRGGADVWGGMTTIELEQAFSNHPIVRACVARIADTAAVPKIEIGSWIADDWRPLANHDLLDLLKYPTPFYTENDFLGYMAARLKLTGVSYAWKIRGANGKGGIANVMPLPTNWVTPVRAKGGALALWSGFRVHGQGGQTIAADDMIVCRENEPATVDGCASCLQAAMREYRMDLERQQFQIEMLTNCKVPTLVISTERPLTDDQKKEAKQFLDARVGHGKRGDALLLPNGAKAEMFTPLSDLDWPGVTSLGETRICAAFGVPPIIIHARAGLERATYSNYEQARRAFYVDTMAPIWDKMSDALTLGLLRSEREERLEFRFRYDKLPEFQEDESKRALRVMAEFAGGNGIITRDEARGVIGLEKAKPEDFPEPAAAQIVDATPGAQVPAKAAAQ